MKKIALILTLSLIVGLTGCTSSKTSSNNVKNESTIETIKEQEEDMEKASKKDIEEKNTSSHKVEKETEETISSETNESEETTISTETSENVSESEVIETETVEVLNETVETPVDEYIWVNTNANVRSGPSTDFGVLGTLSYGSKVHRIAVLETGWSKIEYKDDVAYISSKLVQTTEIVIPKNEEKVDTSSSSTELCVGVAKEIFDATNAERVAAGLSPLTWSDELARAADVRAEEIITTFSHTRPDGTKCYSLSSLVAGENIIRGPHATGSEMVAHWMDSDGHRANILYSGYGSIGISTRCTERGDTACQLFGY